MNVRLDIKEFIEELEVYSKQKLSYPEEVGELLQIVIQTGLVGEFDDLIFQAKFLVGTQEVMKRIGPGVDGFEKLSAEFQSSVKKSINFLKILVERAPSEVTRKLTDMFIVMETDSFSRLMKLFSDLSWVKNWQVDGKQLPYYKMKSTAISDFPCGIKENKLVEKGSVPLIRIQKSALSGTILFVLFLFIDPPVTIFGWILSLWISVFLLYIIIQIYVMNRTLKS